MLAHLLLTELVPSMNTLIMGEDGVFYGASPLIALFALFALFAPFINKIN